MFKTLFTILTLCLCGCVTDGTTYLADGSQGHHVTCGGSWFSMGDCVQRAGEICGGGGYTVMGQNGETIPYSIMTAYGNNAVVGMSSSSGAIVQRDLFIKCN